MTGRQQLLAALAWQPVQRPPVWPMRQAGRYLSEYRAVRSQHTLLQMVHQPDVATKNEIKRRTEPRVADGLGSDARTAKPRP